MKKRFSAALALLLAAVLLSGCGLTDGIFGGLSGRVGEKISQIVGMAEKENGRNPDGLSFDEMVYSRPDVEKLSDDIAAVESALESGEKLARVIELLDVCADDYNDFSTMYSLANIHNCHDLRDEYYADEYAFCSEQSAVVSQLFDELYYACAGSKLGNKLEEEYFWDGFCEEYADPDDSYYNDVTVALMQQESDLISRYRDLMAEPTIEYRGKEVSFYEILDSLYGREYLDALRAYYEKYNEPLAEIYIELMRVRTAMAEEMGFESCEAMEYEFTFHRDYTPADGARFVEDVKRYIVPLYERVSSDGLAHGADYSPLSSKKLYSVVSGIMNDIGGDCAEAFAFMSRYELYDIEPGLYKANSSFQTYLNNYECPFIFVNPGGTVEDVMTFVHEFGHYTDAYVNFDADETIDLAECFSQGLEYLSLWHMDGVLSETQIAQLRTGKMIDTLDTFVQQSSFADFESRAHAIGPDALSAEKLNELALQMAQDYGYCTPGMEEYMQYVWMDITHLFEYPFYVISYPVSAEVAMQLYELELAEEGKGLEKYFEMMPRDYSTFMETVTGCALESPFAEGRMKALAEAIGVTLGYDDMLSAAA